MNGTFLALRPKRQAGQFAKTMAGPNGVLGVLALSAVVSGGAAYVAVDYITSPFAPITAAGVAPMVEPDRPFLADAPRPGDLPSAPRFNDGATAVEDIEFAALDLPGESGLSDPRLAYSRSNLGLSPEEIDQLFAFAPTPRPREATSEFGAIALAPQPRPAAAPAPVEIAEATLGPGVTLSLRPETRPAGFASVVASARRPAEETVASSIAVARAAAPDVEITPARLEPQAGLFGPIRGADNPCSARLTRDIPNRSRSAPEGSAFIAGLDGLHGATRDAAIVQAAFAGNIPDFMRRLRPVSFSGVSPSGQETVVTICVTPDYLALGSDRDFVRVPLGLPAALQIADRFEMMLPTPRMVDAIYAQADLRLSPQPMTPGPQMESTGYFLRHDGLVDDQMARAGGRLGLLVAGQKKDLVLANRLSSNPGRVAIYGWHRASGNPIQPLSTVHGAQYADYSHGIRLVSRTAFVNGRAVDLGTLLTDAYYAGLLNSDGPITGRAMQMAALR